MIKNADSLLIKECLGYSYLIRLSTSFPAPLPVPLNEMGAGILSRLIRGESIKEVSKSIAAECEVDASLVETDVKNILSQMPYIEYED